MTRFTASAWKTVTSPTRCFRVHAILDSRGLGHIQIFASRRQQRISICIDAALASEFGIAKCEIVLIGSRGRVPPAVCRSEAKRKQPGATPWSSLPRVRRPCPLPWAPGTQEGYGDFPTFADLGKGNFSFGLLAWTLVSGRIAKMPPPVGGRRATAHLSAAPIRSELRR